MINIPKCFMVKYSEIKHEPNEMIVRQKVTAKDKKQELGKVIDLFTQARIPKLLR